MKTPTLNPETEREFSKIILEWIESQWKIEEKHQAGEPYTRMKFEAEAHKVEEKLKQFIAKVEQRAIEAKRERILNLMRKIVKPKSPLDIEGSGNAIRDIGYNMALNDVLEIITEKQL